MAADPVAKRTRPYTPRPPEFARYARWWLRRAMNVDLHLSRLSSFGFTHLLGLVAPLSGRHTEIYKYGKHKLRYPLFYFAWGGMNMRRRFVEIRREWMQERLRERDKQRQQQLQRKQVIPRCVFCGDILESRRRKYCPAPKHCKSRATYERTFRSLGLWRGPNRIEQLKKWLLNSGGSHRYNSLKYALSSELAETISLPGLNLQSTAISGTNPEPDAVASELVTLSSVRAGF